jgi:redox-regulated HSP33 family molecular chaperone
MQQNQMQYQMNLQFYNQSLQLQNAMMMGMNGNQQSVGFAGGTIGQMNPMSQPTFAPSLPLNSPLPR